MLNQAIRCGHFSQADRKMIRRHIRVVAMGQDLDIPHQAISERARKKKERKKDRVRV